LGQESYLLRGGSEIEGKEDGRGGKGRKEKGGEGKGRGGIVSSLFNFWLRASVLHTVSSTTTLTATVKARS